MQSQLAVQVTQFLSVCLLSISLANLVIPAVASAQPCNPLSCLVPSTASCSSLTCPTPSTNPCLSLGCSAVLTSNNNSNLTDSSVPINHSFQVINNSGMDLYYLYTSPAGRVSWSDEVLGDNTLPHGQTWNLNLNGSCHYDFQTRVYNDTRIVWYSVDVCNKSSITLMPIDHVPNMLLISLKVLLGVLFKKVSNKLESSAVKTL